MMNDWKRVDEIIAEYGYSKSAFYRRRAECLANPRFRKAIITDSKRKTFIVEPIWQEFLDWRSDQSKQDILGLNVRGGHV